MATLNVITNIQYNPGKEIEYERETHGQERGINKKQPDLRDRNIKPFAKIGAYTKRVPFKKSNYSL